MAQEIINIGTSPNDGTGDPLRTAFEKVNDNFTELYSTPSASSFADLTGDPYDNTNLADALDAKADSDNVVDLTSNQEIDGVKTFLNEVNVNSIVYADGIEVNGATNTQSLYVNGLASISSFGSGDTLTVNHSSGSGKAVVINKAGNGEGLLINKTSGSGNALTVMGDIEATNIKRTGGTSSQFLKANGSVDSTVYQPALTNPVTGTGTTNFLPKFTGATTLGNSQIFDNGTNVGINTLLPLTRLQVSADAINNDLGQLVITGTNTNKRLTLGFNTTSNYGYIQAIIAGDNYYPLVLQPTLGNVGIGTATPTEILHVNGTARATRLGLGLASNAASHLALAANTTTIGQTLMTPSATDYTGTVSGMFWNNASEIKFYDGVLAGVNRLVKTSRNQAFSGFGNAGIVSNNAGDLSALPIVERLQAGTTTKTANYTVALTDFGANGSLSLYADTAFNNITITLPNASNMIGLEITIIKTWSGNSLTIQGDAFINGSASVTETAQYKSTTLISDGNQYFIKS